tara:strand:- start:35 stop:136 length:102 start_codon:yes stop_codon:yes gene_type:complete
MAVISGEGYALDAINTAKHQEVAQALEAQKKSG